MPAAFQQQHARGSQRQRYRERERRSHPRFGLQADRALQIPHVALHHVQADAPAGHLRHLRRGAEPRPVEDLQDLLVGDRGGLGGGQEGTVTRHLADALHVHTAAVVLNVEDHLAAVGNGAQGHCAGRGLPGGLAVGRRLDAVVDGVAQQVEQGIVQGIEDLAVQACLFALDDQVDLLAGGAGQVAHGSGKTLEEGGGRQEAQVQAGIVHLAHEHAAVGGETARPAGERCRGGLCLGKGVPPLGRGRTAEIGGGGVQVAQAGLQASQSGRQRPLLLIQRGQLSQEGEQMVEAAGGHAHHVGGGGCARRR